MLFVVILAAALICICTGIYRVWGSFTEFDEAILRDKDDQFFSILRSDDINIENSMDSFVRESEALFGSSRLEQLRQTWADSKKKDTAMLQYYFRDSTLAFNPLFADVLMIVKDQIVVSAGETGQYTFVTDPGEDNLRICTGSDGRFYLAYEYPAAKNTAYEALIDLEKLYMNSLGNDTGSELMLLDSTSTIFIHQNGSQVTVEPVSARADRNTELCRACIIEHEAAQKEGGTSVELSREADIQYTARVVVIPSGSTANGTFALAVTADYDKAVGPSRQAAGRILVYGGLTVAGILIIIFMLFLLRRENTATARELEMLRKKAATMEELNQNMLALSHHQRLETIGTMTASIAHDFNNLLTPIMGYSMMSMEMLPEGMEDIRENLMEVYNASVKAKDMVARLAELSKKRKEEDFKPLDPDEIVKNTLAVTLPAKPKNVEVRGNLHAGQAKMMGDATQISQLIMNIVLNAYDAMRETGGTLYASSGLEDGRISLRFRDTGCGMDTETMTNVFDPFYTTKESGKGTGLGLAIVAQIAETHEGKVYVNSAPGEGTEFRITFPVIEGMGPVSRAKTIQISTKELREMLNKENQDE